MKIPLFCFWLIVFVVTKANANPDSLLNVMNRNVNAVNQKVDSVKRTLVAARDSIRLLKPYLHSPVSCDTCVLSWFDYGLIAMPVAIFLILLFYFLRWLKREKFKLGDALSGDQPVDKALTRVTTQDAANPSQTRTQETEEPVYPRSSSRVIAFITGLAAIVIALTVVSLYAYGYITGRSENTFKLDELWKVIAGLGIGVVPYAAKVIKEKPTNT
ncbi:MAG: hypothetical protein QM534_00300 [Sediminibacterium sp.]|nr:hypothetical protein [Sediminibacterium sp.]